MKAPRRPLLVVPQRQCVTCQALYRDPVAEHDRCLKCVRRGRLTVLMYHGTRPKAVLMA